jgi:glucose 1-dehydrogenase
VKHVGKVAIVTGAASGIGLACAERLHHDGAQVILADINEKGVKEAASRLDSNGASAIAVLCDVSSRQQMTDLVGRAVRSFGKLDIMVNNAGVTLKATVLDITDAEFDPVLGINLKGTFYGTQEAARIMVQQGGGAIVNMSSTQAVLTIPTSLPYAISKGGINQLTKVFAIALANKNIRVNAVGPGTILTALTRTGVLASEDTYRSILSRTPMGRCGEPSEIASIVSFLASDDASYITGQTIYADGGRLPLNYTVPVDRLPKA